MSSGVTFSCRYTIAEGDGKGAVINGVLTAVGAKANKVGKGKKPPGGQTAKSSSGNCFPEGTLILTPDGQVPIEDIDEGELVLAFDEENKSLVAREVTKLVRGTLFWMEIDLGVETVTATRGHRFWVETVGDWIPAIDLQPGMTVREAGGEIRESF